MVEIMKLEEKFTNKYLNKNSNMRKKNFIVFIFLITISCKTEKKDFISNDNIQLSDLIERVEPPNWWVGMKTNDLELLVYGNQLLI